jgi:hypothetical protein
MVYIESHKVEVVEVEDIDAVAGLKSMLASVVFVIVLSIESPVNANMDTVTPNAEVSAVDITSIYQIMRSLSAKDFPAFLCFPVRAL